MALSYTPAAPGVLSGTDARPRRRVLVTGAAGRIGSYFAEHARDRYDLRLMVRAGNDARNIEPFGPIVTADLSDLDRLKQICAGIDTVVHLAADPDPSAVWQELLDANIVGTYNLFVAAKACACRRVIYASSIHAVSGYPADVQVKTTDPVNPGDLYGVSKCFGEALARYMAEQEGLSSIVLRIGGFAPVEAARRQDSAPMLDAFISQRDLQQLIERCIDAPNLQFAIVHALSDNRFKRMDISDARELLGYSPQDDLGELNPRLHDLRLGQTIPAHNVQDPGQRSGIRQEVSP